VGADAGKYLPSSVEVIASYVGGGQGQQQVPGEGPVVSGVLLKDSHGLVNTVSCRHELHVPPGVGAWEQGLV
jgi:hypothetical protein